MIDYDKLSDIELVASARGDDVNALVEIFRRYRNLLLLFSYSRLGDLETSKDLILKVFIEFWENMASIDVSSGLRILLVSILKNKMLDL